VIPLDGGFFEGPVHPFDLTVCPRMVRLGEPVFDAVLLAQQVEHAGPPPGRRPRPVLWQVAELNAVVSEQGVDLVWDGLDQGFQERCSYGPIRPVVQLGISELRRAVDRNKEMKLSFLGSNLRDVDVEEADWVGFEDLSPRLVPFDLRQPADAVALETAVQ
jgi:hypothetical protein